MISVLCAMLTGITIVLSRSVNSYLSQRVGVYQSTFFNYLTGLITSLLIVLGVGVELNIDFSYIYDQPILLTGGIIGVFNIFILNIIVVKISPVKLTLITFIAQLSTSIVLDYFIYYMFSMYKLIGCLIVVLGLLMYQYSDKDEESL
ncbi:DMT family transporter [Candidatus Stoquefichus massiliensis]|uniref:DMT family transporter n=1 Tax=Candidatus Stoquefichus massiliensis TaxID=1470350 RepID=UPI0004843F86|nr:DMT family transporter [Candidatus Stoquefichus massiliensis]